MPDDTGYPDVLGFITDGERYSVGVVDVALAVHPRVGRAGRPFEVITLVQNTVDAPVDVTVEIKLPDKDARGKNNRFVTSNQRLVVGVAPGEVGYIKQPVSTMPDTAASKEYTVALEINAKPLDKTNQIRDRDGSRPFDPVTLPENQQQRLASLKKLKFSTRKRGFIRGNTLEADFGLLAGKTGKPLNLKAGWVSLWNLADQNDIQLLIDQYGEMMRLRMLPKLNRKTIAEPLLEKTKTRFSEAGYPLRDAEASAVAKLLTLILEYADSTKTAQGIMEAGIYNIEPRLTGKSLLEVELDETPPLPRWAETMLRAVAHDERVANVPQKAVPHFAYDDLLFDACMYAFEQVERASGEVLGTEEERVAYAEVLLEKLSQKGEINFSYAYMPLVLGGIIVYDRVLRSDDNLGEFVQELRYIVEKRYDEQTADNELIFAVAHRIVDQILKKYGSLGNR